LYNSLASCLLKALFLISVLSCSLNLNTNTLAAFYKVASKFFLIIRSNNNNKVLIANLLLDLLNKVKDSREKYSFKLIRKLEDLILL
jgi:hypothetical protein